MENSDFQVLLQAVIDARDVQEQLSRINDLSVHIQKLNLDQAAINGLREQLSQKGIDLNLALGNSSMAQASKTGQQIGKLISDSAQRAIDNASSKSIGKYFKIDPSTSSQFNAEMEKLVSRWTNGKGKLADIKINTRTSFDENAGKQIERLHQATVTYKNELNEVIQKTIAWRKTGTGFDTDGNLKDIYGFAETASQYSKSLDTATSKTKSFTDQQKKTVTNLSNQLKQIYRDATDPNASKPVKDSGNLASLKTQYDKVTAAINKMGSVSGSAFTDEQNKVNTLISDLKIMVKEYKNAETVATSLRSKDLATVKSQYSSKLDVLTTKMKSSGAYTKGFQNGADNLRDILASATDASGLTAFLNGLDKLDAGYKRAKASAEAFNRSQKVGINVSGLESKIADWQRISPEINSFKTNIDGADVTVQSLLDDLGRVATQSGFSVASAKVNAFGKAAKAAGITLTELVINSEAATNKINKIQFQIDTGSYEAKVKTLVSQTMQWTDGNGNARISTDALAQSLQKLYSASDALSKNNSVENQKALVNAEKELDTQIKTVTSSIRSMNAEFAKDSAISSLHSQIQKFYDNNSAAHRKWGSQLKQMLAETSSGAGLTTQRVNEIKAAFNNVTTAARQAGKTGKSWFESFKDATKFLTYWTSPAFITMKAVSEVKEAINTIKGLDTALVDLKKTTTMTQGQLEDFYYDASGVAKEMGVSTQQIIEQASSWSRLGYSSAEAATKMAEYSSMFATISPGMDLDSATDGLVSVMKAFKIGGNDVNEVVDGIMSKINIIGNTRALSNSDIVEFLRRSSSAMAEANNSLEDTIALGTAITEITRDAANAGQVLKTVSMRIRGYDEETEEYIGGVEQLAGEIASLTKTAATPGGISLFSDAAKTEYKSTRELFSEISKIYDDLSDKDQAQLLEALAGKHNGQAVAAILNNYEAVEDSLASMANSAGNAEAEMNTAMDSIEFKLNRLKETGTGIAQNLFGREDIKTAIDGFTKLAEAVELITSKLGMSGTLGLGAGLFAGIKNVGRDKMLSLSFNCFICRQHSF